ncbi:N-acetyl-1-D-myo-inositol-2-amino-2-deoxy-alpha-D-glucopyranoside deacetylase [Gordonia sp. CPCC 205333]|uniref:N-acetyl-1-D-myo-inositol-2-amino-2-deoxy-alpha- D-glucopyranoside deacetylase n=1 Tax=Gordonia sp. CPCC 205333 TaxID=3140790 RepID=UPI003AF35684
MTLSRRLLLLHAHPDDESLMTGGTIARYLAEGVDVRVLTFTLGEEGEVIGDQWAQLVAAGGADQLGGLRIGELAAALSELTPEGREPLAPRFLGGAGHWRDSGMAGAPSAAHPRALAGADFDDVVAALVGELVEFAPQVVVTYDPAGTYGHPDHQTVHAVSAAAIPVAVKTLDAQLKVYESVTQSSALLEGLGAVGAIPDGWRMPTAGELPSYPDDRITAEIDVEAVYRRKVAALRAHATQVTVAPSGTEYALSNNILQPIGRREHFIRTGWYGADDVSKTVENDLFAGLS